MQYLNFLIRERNISRHLFVFLAVSVALMAHVAIITPTFGMVILCTIVGTVCALLALFAAHDMQRGSNQVQLQIFSVPMFYYI